VLLQSEVVARGAHRHEYTSELALQIDSRLTKINEPGRRYTTLLDHREAVQCYVDDREDQRRDGESRDGPPGATRDPLCTG
jgi:hypothetical protein